MNRGKSWVALLDEDEEDYLYWQHGFHAWATHLELRWFSSVSRFLEATSLGESKPVALILDGVVPRGEEAKWLSTMLLHPGYEHLCIFMLSTDIHEEERKNYLRLGASDYLIKPSGRQELQMTIQKVTAHIDACLNKPD